MWFLSSKLDSAYTARSCAVGWHLAAPSLHLRTFRKNLHPLAFPANIQAHEMFLEVNLESFKGAIQEVDYPYCCNTDNENIHEYSRSYLQT